MPSTHRRVAVAGILTAAAIAVPAAALAAGSDTPHPKPQHPGATAGASGTSEAAPPDLSRLASSAGISMSRLEAGLRAAKPAGGDTPAGIAAFTAATGVSNATAHRIVATVFGANSPRPEPGNSAGASGKSGTADPGLSRVASSAGISVSRLQAGLVAAKQAGGNNPAGIAAFAAAAGVSNATAHRIVTTVFGSAGMQPLTGPASAAVLASHLGVSRAAAQRALQQVVALDGKDGVDPASAAFARIAHGLGVSPARLAAGLDAVKRSMAGQ
jgi:hypothetical protein